MGYIVALDNLFLLKTKNSDNMKKWLFLFGMSLLVLMAYSQNPVTGIVLDDKDMPMIGTNVYWADSQTGTITDTAGHFSIMPPDTQKSRLVVSYIGFVSDTFLVASGDRIKITISAFSELSTIVFEATAQGAFISSNTVSLTEYLTQKAFRKAACCNLSESFETNASIDVSFTDAVTGAKQIQMLGLDGKYVQLTTELLPSIRGLAAPFGLSYIAGTWLESIQISKGAGSVVNGFEAVTGQINIELRKPQNDKRLHLNAYANHMGRTEANAVFSHRFKKGKWYTSLLWHGDIFATKIDHNDDSFLDIPLVKQTSFVHRWQYNGERIETIFGIKGLAEDREGGNLPFFQNDTLFPMFGFGMQTWRAEGFWKFGIFFPGQDWKSIGIQASGFYHDQRGFFGLRDYKGKQANAFFNLIYQSIIVNTQHKFKAGATFMFDQVSEMYDTIQFNRTEYIPGIYLEYTFDNLQNFSLILGGRIDYHSLYGFFPLPRLNLRWEITKGLVFRVSGGRGWRVPSVFAENTAVLVSQRQLVLTDYSVKPEVAWNYGASLQYNFSVRKRNAGFVIDFFRTDFTNQLLTDRETPSSIRFSNLEGASFSNVLQFSFHIEPVKRFEIQFAYKWQDVCATLSGNLVRLPFVSEHKGFINLAYTTPKWGFTFDFTTKINGPSRLPEINDPSGEVWRKYTPWYPVFNAQITKDFKILSWYIGCENIGGYKQSHPIVSPQNPFGNDFDASLIWAPIIGQMFYTGLRFDLDYKERKVH